MKKIIFFLFCIALCFSIVACGSGNYLAKVEKEEINKEELTERIILLTMLTGQDYNTMTPEDKAELEKIFLEEWVDVQLIKLSFDNKSNVLDKKYVERIEQLLEEEQIKAFLKDNKISKKNAEKILIDQLYVGPFRDKLVEKIKEPTEEEISENYQNNKNMYADIKLNAKHILVSENDLDLAKEIIVKLKAGEDFGKLAKEYSIDPGSAERNGELGDFSPQDMVPEFAAACLSLEPGQLSEPVKSQFGYHIIFLNSKVKNELSLEEAKPHVYQAIMEAKISEEYEKELAKLHKEYKVVYSDNGKGKKE